MTGNPVPLTIPVLEDDADDRMLRKEAFEAAGLRDEFSARRQGRQCLARGRGGEMPAGQTCFDLNMPDPIGLEALAVFENDAARKSIPVVVLAGCTAEGRRALQPQARSRCADFDTGDVR